MERSQMIVCMKQKGKENEIKNISIMVIIVMHDLDTQMNS